MRGCEVTSSMDFYVNPYLWEQQIHRWHANGGLGCCRDKASDLPPEFHLQVAAVRNQCRPLSIRSGRIRRQGKGNLK